MGCQLGNVEGLVARVFALTQHLQRGFFVRAISFTERLQLLQEHGELGLVRLAGRCQPERVSDAVLVRRPALGQYPLGKHACGL